MKKSAILRSLWLFLTAALIPFFGKSQNENDALKFSESFITSTAKGAGMSGAVGAGGNDFSVASINPAGLAFYDKSEISISPGALRKKTESRYFSTDTISRADEKYYFGLNHLGMVFAIPMSSKNVWTRMTIAAGFNQINNFNEERLYQGFNADNSVLDALTEQANSGDGTSPKNLNPFGSLALESGLIENLPGDSMRYISDLPYAGVQQRRSESSSGSMQEIILAYAANYDDLLLFGLTIGAPIINSATASVYEESDAMDTLANFGKFQFSERTITKGNGFNAKVGLVAQVTEWCRIGAAFHTPSFLNLRRSYSSSVSVVYDDGNFQEAKSPESQSDYTLRTPPKGIMSAAFFIGEIGKVGIDYEVADYSNARLHSSSDPFFEENDAIQRRYRVVSNIRIGTEWEVSNFLLRAGYAFYGSPLYRTNAVLPTQSSPGTDMSQLAGSLGIGMRQDKYFLDLGYSLAVRKDKYRPYSLKWEEVPVTASQAVTHSFNLTFGFIFR